MNEENPMTTEEESATVILSDFMEQIQEFESEVAGTPTDEDMNKLANIYHETYAHLAVLLKEVKD